MALAVGATELTAKGAASKRDRQSLRVAWIKTNPTKKGRWANS